MPRTLTILIICGLVSSRLPAWPDELFPNVNPYMCIREAKSSQAPDGQRRANLAACMTKVYEPIDAVEALDRSGFNVGAIEAHDLRRLSNSGQTEKARALLTRMILGGR